MSRSAAGRPRPAMLALLCWAAAAAVAPPATTVTYHVAVTGLPLAAARPISPGFVGLSIETYASVAMLGAAAAPRAALARGLANFARMTPGPHEGPVLRIGGNSADSSCWLPEVGGPPILPAAACSCGYNLTTADLDTYRAFANLASDLGANVSFVLDTNLGCGSPALAAAHIAAISRASLWDIVSGIEVGNEIDKFPGSKRPATYSYADYAKEFAVHIAAYKPAGLPSRRIQGAVFCDFVSGFDAGLAEYARDFRTDLGSLSYHSYSLHGGCTPLLAPQFPAPSCNTSSAYHREALLSPAATVGHAAKYLSFAADAAVAAVPLVIGEGNTESGGGWANASDVFVSALWALDWLPEISKAGAVRQNFHGGPDGWYCDIKCFSSFFVLCTFQ